MHKEKQGSYFHIMHLYDTLMSHHDVEGVVGIGHESTLGGKYLLQHCQLEVHQELFS